MSIDLAAAKGSSAIPLTPFTKDDRIDEDILASEIEFILRCGSTSITTPVMYSEFDMLSESERRLMIKIPCETARDKIPVIACASASNPRLASEYAEYAQEHGASGIIAMAPPGVDFPFIKRYFKAISDAVTVPVMIQNHSTAGTPMTPPQVIQLCEEIENVSWVKQESAPGPASISDLMKMRSPALKGVMSGYGSQYSPMDFYRGAVASIHACEWADLVQQVWDLFFLGKEEEGRNFHYRILPALQIEGLLGIKYAKEVMVRRGVFKNNLMRKPSPELSDDDRYETDKIFELVEPYLIPTPLMRKRHDEPLRKSI
jgi:4-hydroxy-tetrahydrodipicolinate synthase